MLFCTSLVALVGAGDNPNLSPRRLQIVNTKRESTICELTFVSGILAVKLNRKRLVVILEEHIYIYDISNMKLLHTIDTNPNPNALGALSPSSENCYLAYPSNSSGSAGELLIFDATHLQPINIIQAHKNPLSSVFFNYDGSMVATSSDKVFSLLFTIRAPSFASLPCPRAKNCISLDGEPIPLASFPFHSISQTRSWPCPQIQIPFMSLDSGFLTRRKSRPWKSRNRALLNNCESFDFFLVNSYSSEDHLWLLLRVQWETFFQKCSPKCGNPRAILLLLNYRPCPKALPTWWHSLPIISWSSLQMDTFISSKWIHD